MAKTAFFGEKKWQGLIFLYLFSFHSSSEKVAKYRIEFDRPGCIGAAACIAVAPEAWKMGEDGKAIQLVFEFDEKDLHHHLDAARACPVNVIHIVDEKGKRLV